MEYLSCLRALIEETHRLAQGLGYKPIVILGHTEYYPRFRYQPCSKYIIKLPFESPEENSRLSN